MTTATRIRRLAARKARVQITKRKRCCAFRVSGPDGQTQDFPSKTAALNNLLVRLRCWSPPPWEIKPMGK